MVTCGEENAESASRAGAGEVAGVVVVNVCGGVGYLSRAPGAMDDDEDSWPWEPVAREAASAVYLVWRDLA